MFGPLGPRVENEMTMSTDAKLAGPIDLAGFRSEARQLLAHQIPPNEVLWAMDPARMDGYEQPVPATASRPRNVARAATAIVPASFTRLSEFVVLHRDERRFALLYRLLWRLVHEPGLRNDPLDPDMLEAQHMAHAVRRDIHKMKANLKLQDVRDPEGGNVQMGSFEPTHHVVEAVGPWLCKRLPVTRWYVFTPDRSVHCDDGKLTYGPGIPAAQLPHADAPDSAWVACRDTIFRSRPAA
jgi:probable DNA metabolism protein